MKRREFLRYAASACMFCARAGLPSAAPQHPNIVLICADDSANARIHL
jgi:hypothetical protein